MPNWYNQKRTARERRAIYGFLRVVGLEPKVAATVRGWSVGHILRFVDARKDELIKKFEENCDCK